MSKKIVFILVHGYNVSDPGATVGKLRKPLEDLGAHYVDMCNYYHTNLMQVRWRNPKVAKELNRKIDFWKSEGCFVALVGHSNGCAIINVAHSQRLRSYKTINQLNEPDYIFCINPALHKHIPPWHGQVPTWVLYNGGDKPVRWAKWLSKFIPKDWFDVRPWGEMGRVGYQGKSSVHKIKNIHTYFHVPHEGEYLGHSGLFKRKESVKFWAEWMWGRVNDPR